MAMLTLVEAARKTGLTTLARAIKSGRLSVSRKEDGSYEIDPANWRDCIHSRPPGETVTATGPVVRHATADADRYWISQWQARAIAGVGASFSRGGQRR
jgi:hypothetical protein